MGREVRRVPLDFNWPLGKTWGGYLREGLPEAIPCPACQYSKSYPISTGESPEYYQLTRRWYGWADVPFRPEDRGSTPFLPTDPVVVAKAERNVSFTYDRDLGMVPRKPWSHEAEHEAVRLANLYNEAWSHHLNQDDVDVLIEKGRLHDFTHDWDKETRKWVEKPGSPRPTAEEVNRAYLTGMGHDSINMMYVCQAEAERLGIQTECPVCKGERESWACEEDRLAHEAWEKTEPPEGDAYQMWETVSEGSPISPPFATPEELARHMADSPPWGADRGTPYESWLKFIRGPGWAPSLIIQNGIISSGVDAMIEEER